VRFPGKDDDCAPIFERRSHEASEASHESRLIRVTIQFVTIFDNLGFGWFQLNLRIGELLALHRGTDKPPALEHRLDRRAITPLGHKT